MISASYIHAFDDVETYENYHKKSIDFFKECESSLDVIISDIKYKSIFMESCDEYYTEADSIFKKVGDKIIELFNKALAFVNNIIAKIKEKAWNRKDKEKLLNKMSQENPELASKIRYQIDAKKLTLNQFKDINDFYRNIDQILNEIEKDNAKSLKGKALKAKKALEGTRDVIIDIGKVAGAIGTVVATIATLRHFLGQGRKDAEDGIKVINKGLESGKVKVKGMTEKFTATGREVSFHFESAKDISIEELKDKQAVLNEVSQVLTSTSVELSREYANYINTMDTLVDRTISKGGEKL